MAKDDVEAASATATAVEVVAGVLETEKVDEEALFGSSDRNARKNICNRG